MARLSLKNLNIDSILKVRDWATTLDDKPIYLLIGDNKLFLESLFGLLYADKFVIISPNGKDDGYILNDTMLENILLNDKDADHNISLESIYSSIKLASFSLLTSGSSGKLSIIEKKIYQMEEEAKALQLFFSTFFGNKQLVIKSIVPHLHMYGLTFAIFLPFVSGFEVEEHEAILENISNFHADIFITSPTFLQHLAMLDKKWVQETLKVKSIVSAGSMLSSELRSNISSITPAILINIYGSTETGVIARDVGNGLIPFDGVDLRIEEELCYVSSPWVEEYALKDMLELSLNGYIIIRGRSDRIVKVVDKRYSLDMIEADIKTSPLIKDAYAYLEDNSSVAYIAALVSLSAKGIEPYCRQGIAYILKEIRKINPQVKRVKIVEQIYRNSAGKLVKSENDSLINSESDMQVLEKHISREGDKLKLEAMVYVPESYAFFKDHFSTFPIVPGVLQVELVQRLASSEFGLPFTNIERLSNIKFTSIIRPLFHFDLSLEYENKVLSFLLSSKNGEKLSSGKIIYKA